MSHMDVEKTLGVASDKVENLLSRVSHLFTPIWCNP